MQQRELSSWLFIVGGDAPGFVHPKKRPQSQTARALLYPEGVASASMASTTFMQIPRSRALIGAQPGGRMMKGKPFEIVATLKALAAK